MSPVSSLRRRSASTPDVHRRGAGRSLAVSDRCAVPVANDEHAAGYSLVGMREHAVTVEPSSIAPARSPRRHPRERWSAPMSSLNRSSDPTSSCSSGIRAGRKSKKTAGASQPALRTRLSAHHHRHAGSRQWLPVASRKATPGPLELLVQDRRSPSPALRDVGTLRPAPIELACTPG